MIGTGAVRRAVGWAMAAVVVLSLLTWWLTRSPLPPRIRIATAMPGGQYHRLGELLAERVGPATGRPVEALTTRGSVENLELLRSGATDLAVVQAGAAPLQGLSVLAPAHPDVVHVVVRRQRGIERIVDLAGRRVVVGPEGSGMRPAAQALLRHYRVLDRVDQSDAYFLELLTDVELEAAVVTTGFINDDLARVLTTGDFELLPVLDAEAIGIRRPFFGPATIPRGLHSESPPVPPRSVPTVATTALLLAREDVPDVLVEAVLEALYQPGVRERVPTLIGRAEAGRWSATALHPAARRWFDPYGGLGVLASFMESLAAGKELLFALVASGWLLWSRWRGLREDERAGRLAADKERLDAFLDETVAIEREQVGERDPARLKLALDRLTDIKLRALEELSHEDLRGDRMFHIFLTQCASLTAKLQAKLAEERQRPRGGELP